MTVRVALAGCGGWGRNILRVLVANPRASVVAVAEPHPERRAAAAGLAPGASVVGTLDEALAAAPDAVAIATPPHTHAALALAALAVADVFVEKPLATCTGDAERLAACAALLGRVGMVGHVLRYHPAVERLVDVARRELGPLLRFEATRCSVAGDRSATVLWTLGPHDLSVLRALDPTPVRVLATRASPPGDGVRIEATLASGLTAAIALSSRSPSKERRMRVLGAASTVSFDDVFAPDRVTIDGKASAVPWREPLAAEMDHFLRCVEARTRPLTSFEEGLSVVRTLAAAERSLSGSSFCVP